MKVAIIGAGAVALSSAALISKNGHHACLWSAIPGEVDALTAASAVTCEGDLAGSFPIQAARDVGQCVAGSDAVMIAAPAFAHRTLMAACTPHVQPGQFIIFNTATGLSSLVFAKLLAERGVRPTIIDLGTSVCMSRVSGPARVRVAPLKAGVDVAAIPAHRGDAGRAVVRELFGDLFVLRESALAISLNNHNPIYHVPALIFNLPRVERGDAWNIWHNMTPFAARYIQKLDDERMAVAECFGVRPVPLADYVRSSIGVAGDDLAALFVAAAEKRPTPSGPKSVEDRFMTEDMPYGMVFFHALGQAAGIAMPLTEHIIDFCSDLYGRNFRGEAPGLEALGLPISSPKEIIRVAKEGF